MCINTIEILARAACPIEDKFGPGETERGNAALVLAIFTNLSPEARRRILKIARRMPHVMDSLKYSNDIIHLELVQAWSHYRELQKSIESEYPILNFGNEKIPLPPINKNNSNGQDKNILIH
jgi:hypothetical protein